MKKIELFEHAIEIKANNLPELGICPAAFWAYRKSCDAENTLINFDDVVWEEDIPAIAKTFNLAGIVEFTVSSTFSGLIPVLAEFEKHGFKMAGLTEVNANYTDYMTGKRERIPAIRMLKY